MGQGNLAPGSLSTGSPAGRALLLLKRRDGSMYSQANVRTRDLASSSVAVRDRGHCFGVAGSAWARIETGEKVIAPWCASKERTGELARSPKITSDMWSRERLTRKQLTSRPDHLWPELWGKMVKNAKLMEKQKWSNEKHHLENARKLRGIYFIDPEDEEFKETIKNARKKLETSVAPATPCKILKNCGSDGSNKIKTKLACILEADESTRMRMRE